MKGGCGYDTEKPEYHKKGDSDSQQIHPGFVRTPSNRGLPFNQDSSYKFIKTLWIALRRSGGCLV